MKICKLQEILVLHQLELKGAWIVGSVTIVQKQMLPHMKARLMHALRTVLV